METGPSESFCLTPGEDGPLKVVQNISTHENPPSCGTEPASPGQPGVYQLGCSWRGHCGHLEMEKFSGEGQDMGWKRRPSPSFHATSGWFRDMAVNNEGVNHETLVRGRLDGCVTISARRCSPTSLGTPSLGPDTEVKPYAAEPRTD